MNKVYKFILISFLLLPKIPLSPSAGIMLGEILLFACSAIILILKPKVVVFKPIVLSLLVFFTWFILCSSLINALLFNVIPMGALSYFIKILNYFMIFVVAYQYYLSNGYEKARKVFFSAYIWHYVIAMSIVFVYYATHNPSVGDILWNYETGLRAIPLAGLTISPENFAGLTPVGGGSSNLFVSWSLAFALLILLTNHKHKLLLIFLTFLVPLAGMSRGGILTFIILLLYMFFISKSLPSLQKIKVSIIILIISIGGSVLFSNIDINIPNVFDRLSQTIDSGSSSQFDPSTQGRFENYELVFNEWSSNPLYVFFGLGMDENLLVERTGWGLVESFFLQVLFCSGLIGITLLLIFLILTYLNRNRNIWFYALWIFILLESLVMWTITGGDFYSAHVMFVILVFLGYGYAESALCKGNSPLMQTSIS